MTVDEAYELKVRIEREQVAPKFEEWRKHYRYKIAYGGRGAGAKSHSTVSLLIQAARFGLGDWLRPPLRILCLREIQKSLEESSYELIRQKIEFLGYTGFDLTREAIKHSNGSIFLFRGLKDIRSAQQIKSYEGFDIFHVEEAHSVSTDSWRMILPTLRKPLAELWAIFNRMEESDPVYEIFVKNRRPNSSILELRPGPEDNPWFEKTALPAEMAEDYKRDPDEAEHIWGGQPRKQGQRSVMSRVLIREAMDRDIEEPDGQEEIGVDVARFGDDKTEMYRRKGLKIIDHRELIHADTNEVAGAVWEFADQRSDIPIKIDVGYNPGVVDVLQLYGAYVIPINFGGEAIDKDKYPSAASEMWFEFPVAEAAIPDDPELMAELSMRQYNYDKKGRRMIEPKDEFKKRYKRSPDKADALLLCFYERDINTVVRFDPDFAGIGALGL